VFVAILRNLNAILILRGNLRMVKIDHIGEKSRLLF
jgi:hypothetical protein